MPGRGGREGGGGETLKTKTDGPGREGGGGGTEGYRSRKEDAGAERERRQKDSIPVKKLFLRSALVNIDVRPPSLPGVATGDRSLSLFLFFPILGKGVGRGYVGLP